MRASILAIKSIWYILRTVLAIAVVVALLWFSFYTAMGIANMYIIATDGMKKRADVVLTGDVQAELVEYFSPGMLENDVLLLSEKYSEYTIKSYEYKLSIEWIWAWPWKNEGTITASERVYAIDGEMLKDRVPENGKPLPVPLWEDYRYEITLEKDNDGRFYVSKLTKLEKLPPRTTPSPTASPADTPASS